MTAGKTKPGSAKARRPVATPRSQVPKAAMRGHAALASKVVDAEKCGARLRGHLAGLFCADKPMKGRTRCRVHGGASPRAAAHPRTTHGMYSRGVVGFEVFAAPFTRDEQALAGRSEADVPASVKRSIGELDVWIERAGKRGEMATVRMLATAKASLVRAHVSLNELPVADQLGPDLVEMYLATTAEQLGVGPHVIERAGAHA